jgi:hypothetical protein
MPGETQINPDLPRLPCPECRSNGIKGSARIGNRRSECTTCNNFAQNVMRMTRRRLLDLHRDEYAVIRIQVERDLYPQVLDDFRPDLVR